MFKYTIAAIKKTVDDIKFLGRLFEFILAFFQIPFAIYNIVTQSGILLVNIALLVISTAYFIVYLLAGNITSPTREKSEKKKWSNIKAKAKKITRWVKRPVQIYSFAIIIYGLTIPATTIKPLSLILLFLQLILFVLSFLIDLITIIIDKRATLFKEAFEADLNEIKEPGRLVGNVVKSFFGKETTPKPESNKTEQILNKYIEQEKEKQEQAKLAKKQKQEQDRLAKKQKQAQDKEAKRLEKEQLKKQRKENKKKGAVETESVTPTQEVAVSEDVSQPSTEAPAPENGKKKKGFFRKK